MTPLDFVDAANRLGYWVGYGFGTVLFYWCGALVLALPGLVLLSLWRSWRRRQARR